MASNYSEETKAAVMSALLSGQSVSRVADDYNIPEGTVKSWKSRQLNGETVATVATEKKEEIGELLYQYLTASLRALQSQVELFSDRDWLKKQPASDLAVLHGVQTDKAVRIMEAFGRANDSNTNPQD